MNTASRIRDKDEATMLAFELGWYFGRASAGDDDHDQAEDIARTTMRDIADMVAADAAPFTAHEEAAYKAADAYLTHLREAERELTELLGQMDIIDID